MPDIQAKTGNEAMAEAMRQVNPDVVAAYPITPATEIVQIFSSFVADGLVETEFVPVESEHSALSACIGAAAAGARVMTSTASQGLALMHEMLYIAAALRLPMVICEVNRTLSAPINIHCDHSDTMGARDSGWIQIYCEDPQEAYDSVIQAVKMSEELFLPAIASTDGFIISHCMQGIDVLPDDEVQAWLGKPKSPYNLLDVDHPFTVGPLDLQDYFFEHKRAEVEAMHNASPVVERVDREFGETFGRSYGLIQEYRMEDAELGVVALGSAAGTARVAVDRLREKGMKVGLIRLRVFRPFPADKIRAAISPLSGLAVMDRSDSMSGQGGPVFTEIRSLFYESESRPIMLNHIYGLGGRDICVEEIEWVYRDLEQATAAGKVERPINYLGVRE